MKKIICGVGATIVALGALAAEILSFAGKTYDTSGNEKNPLEFALNETAVFKVSLIDTSSGNAVVTGRNLRWTLAGDDGSKRTGTATSAATPLEVSGTLARAGFLRLTVEVQGSDGKWLSGNTEFFDGGAGFDVWNIEEWPKPSDFDAVWRDATNTLFSTPYEATLTPYVPAGADPDIDCFVYSITVPSSPDWPATGMIAMPKDRGPGELGIISHTFGYGYYGQVETPSAREVFAADHDNMVIHMTRYGENPVGTDEYYAQIGADAVNGVKNYGFRNFTSLETSDQYKTHLRNLRALQYLKSRPEWDGKNLSLIGGSLGGYQAICLAGLDPDVTSLNANVPWSVDLGGVKLGRMSGWRPDWVEGVTDYFDAKNFAYNVTCPTVITAGIGDYTCPPSGEAQLYRILSCKKKITFTQNMGHGSLHGPSATCASWIYKDWPDDPEPVNPHRQLNFVGGTDGNKWSVAANWRDAAGGTNDVPRAGDILNLAVAGSVNDLTDYQPYQILVSAFQQQTASEPYVLDAAEGGIFCTATIYYNLPTLLRGTNVPFSASSLLACRTWFKSADGQPCGLVKKGSSVGGIAPYGAVCKTVDDFAGFKYVDVNEGTFAYNVNDNGSSKPWLFPAGQVATFSARNTKLAFNGTCVFTNFWIREMGTAVNRTHSIGTQGADYTGALTVAGTPPVDEMVYTGRMIDNLSFTWAPDSAAKAFVFSGRNAFAAMNAPLRVQNGTVRFREGASFRDLPAIGVGATATLAVADTPSNACTAAALNLSDGATLALDATATVTVGEAFVGVSPVAAGTYTGAAGAEGTRVAWISGAGKLVVERTSYHKLYWRATEGTVSGSGDGGVLSNWVETDGTPAAALPAGGEMIVLDNTRYSKALAPTTAFNNANKATGLGGILFEGNGFVNNSDRAIIWGESALYLAGSGCLLSNGVNAAGAARIWANTKIVGTGTGVTIGTRRSDSVWWQERTLFGNAPVTVDGSGTVRFAAYNADNSSHDPQGGTYSNNYNLKVPELRIRRGIAEFRDWYKLTNTVIRFTGDGTTLAVGFSKADAGYHDLWFGNGTYLDETAGLDGTHKITSTGGACALHVKDRPGAAVQTFTGSLTGATDFEFDPATADYSFVFSKGTSDTTGSLLVGNGTVRLENGAKFTQLAAVRVSPGATLAVDAGSSIAAGAIDILTASGSTGKISVGEGTVLNLAAVTVDGAPVAKGLYGASTAPWIEGAGQIAVGFAYSGRTLSYVGADSGKWSVATNWRDDAGGTNTVPRAGDTLKLLAANLVNDLTDLEPYQLRTNGKFQQGTYNAVILDSCGGGLYDEGYIYFNIPVKIRGTNMPFYASQFFGCNGKFQSADGNPCGLVKTGSAVAGLSPAGTAAADYYRGLKYIDVNQGTFVFNANDMAKDNNKLRCFPSDLVLTFSASGTKFAFNGTYNLTNVLFRETGTAVGATHTVGTQSADYTGSLALRGTPPVDSTVFTGTMTDKLAFIWAPDAATKEFVFSGATGRFAPSVGYGLTVENGTVRFANGASFTADSIALAGGAARLAVEGTPAQNCTASAVTLAAGAKVSVGAGVTLAFTTVNAAGADVPGGVYCAVGGTGGIEAGWIEGEGRVVVSKGNRIYWAATTTGPGSYSGAADPDVLANWKVRNPDGTYSASPLLPMSGNVIVFNNALHSKQMAISSTFIGATAAGLAGVVFEGTGYGVGNTWTMIWGSDPLYLASGALVSNGVAHASQSGRIWKNTCLKGGPDGVRLASVAGGRLLMHKKIYGPVPLIVEGPGTVQLIDYSHSTATTHEPGATYYDSYSIQVPSIELKGGTTDIQCWYKLTNTVVRFASDDPAATLQVGVSGDVAGQRDLWFGNGTYLDEAASVANTAHRMTSTGEGAFLHVKDTPGKAVQTFTGSLSGTLGLDFDPSSSGYSFVFSKGTSDTTGSLVVSNGTVRLANGAKFTQLTRAEVLPGATLAVDADSSLAADELDLISNGSTRGAFSVAAGVTLELARVVVDGELVDNGTYTKANAPWLGGDGTVNVVGGGWPEAIWNRDDYPWSLTAGRTVYKGIDLYGDSLTREQLSAAAGADVLLGPSGIVSAGTGKRYSFGWPILLSGDQTWLPGKGDMLDFYGPLGTLGPVGTVTVKKPASAVQSIFWTASTATHAWTFETNNIVVLRNGAGLGSGTVKLVTALLKPCGVTVPNDICTTNQGGDTYTVIQTMENCGESTFAGNVTMGYSGSCTLTASTGAPLRFAGTLSKPRGYINFTSGGVYSFDAPVSFGTGAMSFDSATLNMNAATNVVGSNNFQFGSNGKLFTTVPYALCSKNATKVTMNVAKSGAAVWNLCGSDQSVTYLKGGPYSTVTSETAAVVHVNSTSNYATDSHAWSSTAYDAGVPTNYVAFAGGAGLQIDGNANGYVRLAGLSSTTGTLTVAGGGLVEMAASQYYPPDGKTYKGQWPNTSAVSVTKGTLDIQHNKAFGKMTTLGVSGTASKVKLSYMGSMRVGGLVLDGVQQEVGTYGSLASSAQHKDSRFEGTGVLCVGAVGEYLIIR